MRPIPSKNPVSSATQQGSVIVELALMLPLLTIFILGAIDLGLIVREHQMIQNAAREGARFAAQPANKIDPVNPSANANTIRDRVINYLAEENITVAATNCTADGTVLKQWNCGAITIRQQFPIVTTVAGVTTTDFGAEVKVTYTRSLLFPGGSTLKFNSVSLSGSSVFHNLY